MLEWFHIGDRQHVEKVIQQLKELHITHLRTGFSWADYYTDRGEEWYDWLIPTLSEHVEVLPCFLYTPPSIGIVPKTSSPPKNPKDYADFLDMAISRFGKYFEWVELWNEPNNISEYDYTLDEQWHIFTEMITLAAHWMKQLGKKTVLGGMSPIDPNWLTLLYERDVMQYIDAVGIHGFPEVFDTFWAGWENEIEKVNSVIRQYGGTQEVWITETGFSTWQHDERRQLSRFISATRAPVARMYWYSINDLDEKYPTIDGFHQDDREYSFGLKKTDGTPKLLYRLLNKHGPCKIDREEWISKPYINVKGEKYILISGGAGFIGTNLAESFLKEKIPVTILDNLSRPGVEKNLRYLEKNYKRYLNVEIADVRNKFAVRKAVSNAKGVFHFAAQVAVTTSCSLPMHDFMINAEGTVNILEAIRNTETPPPLIFTSTNKVYGGLDDVVTRSNSTRYKLADPVLAMKGVSENRTLDFKSPYGCSKGAADAYVLDYARTYGLKTAVFRMSCIYGPHQLGNEDQGWVAHFLIQALRGKPITIYGDGKQVRDILYVQDLLTAFKKALARIDTLSGEAFNIGGGPGNTISLIELIRIIQDLTGEKIPVTFEGWRTGDQKYYVSDTGKFNRQTGWVPRISPDTGIKRLYEWLVTSGMPVKTTIATTA